MATNDDGIIRAKSDGADKAKSGLTDFIQTTRQEITKVTWPDRKETLMTTVMIIVLALIAGGFFLLVDTALGYAVGHLLGMSS